MSKFLATIIAATFAVVTAGAFAAEPSGGAPSKDKDAPKVAKVDCKDEINKDHKDCKYGDKKDETKKDKK